MITWDVCFRVEGVSLHGFRWCVSYKDGEVAWGAGDVSSWGEGLGDVLHSKGCGQDPQGQPDHQIALRAFKCPAVSRIHIRLVEEWERLAFRSADFIYLLVISGATQLYSAHGEAHLNDNTWRLGEVPEWQAKQTHEGSLGFIGLRAAGTEDAATLTHTHTQSEIILNRKFSFSSPQKKIINIKIHHTQCCEKPKPFQTLLSVPNSFSDSVELIAIKIVLLKKCLATLL